MFDTGNLIDNGIMEGVELTGDFCAGEICQCLGVDIRAVSFHDDNQVALIIRVGKINTGFPFFSRRHPGNNGIDFTGIHGQDQSVPSLRVIPVYQR